jgi:putative transcription factor
MHCEMCGQDTRSLKKVIIEYSVLRVCPECAKFGRPVPESKGPSKVPAPIHDKPAGPKPRTGRDVLEASSTRELVSDYPQRVKKARVAKGMTPEELGKLINEKRSVISKLESGEHRPNEKLVRKLERSLNIKLMESVENVTVRKKEARPTTLGDIVKIK